MSRTAPNYIFELGDVPRASGDEPCNGSSIARAWINVPRASGDEPEKSDEHHSHRGCSPRERG